MIFKIASHDFCNTKYDCVVKSPETPRFMKFNLFYQPKKTRTGIVIYGYNSSKQLYWLTGLMQISVKNVDDYSLLKKKC